VTSPGRAFVALAAIAGLEGLALLVYSVFDLVSVIRFGIQGPTEVSNAASVTLQILIFALFGAAMALLARGWWHRRRWARAPFLLGQLLALVVGVPLAQASGRVEQVAGILIVVLAVTGGVLALSRPVGRVLDGAPDGHA
jgi:hypothetical protein